MSCEALASVHISFEARSLVRMSFEACASVCHLKRRCQCVVHSTKLFQRYYFTVFILWTGRFWNIHISTTEAKKKKEGHNSQDSKFKKFCTPPSAKQEGTHRSLHFLGPWIAQVCTSNEWVHSIFRHCSYRNQCTTSDCPQGYQCEFIIDLLLKSSTVRSVPW